MIQATTTFSAAEARALTKFDPKPFGAELPVGIYEVDFLLRVFGTITVAPDYEQLFVTAADLTRILKVALAAHPLDLEALVAAAYADDVDDAALKARLRALIGQHKKKTRCDGQVRSSLDFRRRAGR